MALLELNCLVKSKFDALLNRHLEAGAVDKKVEVQVEVEVAAAVSQRRIGMPTSTSNSDQRPACLRPPLFQPSHLSLFQLSFGDPTCFLDGLKPHTVL